MVEGGAGIITSIMAAHAASSPPSLIDRVNITIAPTFIGGLHSVTSLLPHTQSSPEPTGKSVLAFPRLRITCQATLGCDIVVQGSLVS